jgi:Ca2+/Na+ antiporter
VRRFPIAPRSYERPSWIYDVLTPLDSFRFISGTSLPNYVASKVAAENGFGNQAVSNAFGSNSFNIMVGLGLPWVLYTSFGTNFQPYNGLKDEHILESIVILALVLAVFVVFMLISGFVIHKWHGIVFVLLYVSYVTFAILEVYIGK